MNLVVHAISIGLTISIVGVAVLKSKEHLQRSFSESQQVAVKIFAPPRMPLSVDSATLENQEGKAVLRFHITNRSNEHIKGAHISLRLYRKNGAMRSYGLEDQDYSLPPHGDRELTMEINRIEPEEKALLVLSEVESENSLWDVDSLKLLKAIEGYLKGKPYTLPNALWWEAIKK